VYAGPQEASQAPISGVDAIMKESSAQIYWVRRVIAFAIDWVIVYIVLGILVVLSALPFLVLSGPGVFTAILGGAFTFLAGVILVLYFVALEVLAGATIGKKVMGIKVVAPGGRAPTLAEALVRNVSKLYWLLLVLDVIVGLAVVKGYTQKYSDKLMGTSVVDA
jgi:uncharacterized RDD family membrane protein YckC